MSVNDAKHVKTHQTYAPQANEIIRQTNIPRIIKFNLFSFPQTNSQAFSLTWGISRVDLELLAIKFMTSYVVHSHFTELQKCRSYYRFLKNNIFLQISVGFFGSSGIYMYMAYCPTAGCWNYVHIYTQLISLEWELFREQDPKPCLPFSLLKI